VVSVEPICWKRGVDVDMERRLVNDSFVENLGNVFCRNRQGDIKLWSGCRTDITRAGVGRVFGQARAGRRSISYAGKLYLRAFRHDCVYLGCFVKGPWLLLPKSARPIMLLAGRLRRIEAIILSSPFLSSLAYRRLDVYASASISNSVLVKTAIGLA
jgi:hypothetical protein